MTYCNLPYIRLYYFSCRTYKN